MKVSLIFPNINIGRLQKISNFPTLGLGYLAAATKKAGYDVSVIDASALNLKYKQLKKKLEDFNPDVIGITANISLAYRGLETSRVIQHYFPNKIIVFGGPWPSSAYKMLLRRKFCNYVIVGEGEIAFIDLLARLKIGEIPIGVPGVAYLDEKTNKIQLESPCAIEDLDALPFPAWQFFPSPHKYFQRTKGKIFYPVMTSRGCPYRCNHCTKLIHGYKIRFRSIENVIDEIRYLKEQFNADEILVVDDNFSFDLKRAETIIDEIIRNEFNMHIQFCNGLRADTLTPNWLELQIL